MNSYFSIDKKISLDIIKAIQKTEKKPLDDVDEYSKVDGYYEHKLAFIELQLDNASETDHIKDFYVEIIKKSYQDCYHRSDEIEINDINITELDEIDFTAYLHGSYCDGDTSYPTFSYDETIKTWIICDDFWNTKNGIDHHGNVYILDFNNYK